VTRPPAPDAGLTTPRSAPARAATGAAGSRRAGGLLVAGITGGLLFLASSSFQGVLREGFRFSDHPPSALAAGGLGWVQAATFIVSGLLLVAGSVGLRLALHGPGAVWGPRLIATFGVALVAGGLFPMDPAFGFPPGTAAGPPATISWYGLVHGAVFSVGFGSLVAASVVFSRRYRHDGATVRSWASLACGASSLALAASPNVGDPEGRFVLLWLAVAVGMGWIVATFGDVQRQVAARTGAPASRSSNGRA
jgi:hypothetical protein